MKPHYQLLKIEISRVGLALMLPIALWSAIALPNQMRSATAQTAASPGQNRPLYIRGKMQEYNSKTQVATVRGDVELLYPARGIQATAAQAQYFTRERQIILSGNVYVLQQGGNSIKADTVTYLIDEGRFVATPRQGRQVESIYIVNDNNNPASQVNTPPATPPLQRKN